MTTDVLERTSWDSLVGERLLVEFMPMFGFKPKFYDGWLDEATGNVLHGAIFLRSFPTERGAVDVIFKRTIRSVRRLPPLSEEHVSLPNWEAKEDKDE